MNTQERPDTFRKSHKAIRKALFNTAYQAGYTDFTSPGDVASLLTQFGELSFLLRHHLHTEDMYYLPMLDAKSPGAATYDTQKHEDLERLIYQLETQLNAIVNSPADSKNNLGYAFYLSLNRFVAACLMQMDEEETDTNAKANALCTDEELQDMNRQILANTPPAEADITDRYMLPALNVPERHSLLAEVQASASAGRLNRTLAIAEKVLTRARFQQAISFLGLPVKAQKINITGLNLSRSSSAPAGLPVN